LEQIHEDKGDGMDWKEIYTNNFKRTALSLEKQLKDLSPEVINRQPQQECNSIGWIAWHIARAQDRHLSDVFGVEQLYITEHWYQKFNREANPKDSGTGHSLEQAAAFKAPDAQTLLDYHDGVIAHCTALIESLSEFDLDSPPDYPGAKPGTTKGGWLGGMLGHSYQHLGEIGYIRGLQII
jgi:hypothetical protein